jgi:hypothetical protein
MKIFIYKWVRRIFDIYIYKDILIHLFENNHLLRERKEKQYRLIEMRIWKEVNLLFGQVREHYMINIIYHNH